MAYHRLDFYYGRTAGAIPGEVTKTEEWKASAIAGDIATLGVGVALAAAFNTLLVFFILLYSHQLPFVFKDVTKFAK